MLSLVLVIALAGQGVPVQSLVQAIHQGPTSHHECAHERGYCPMNPDGPCECEHTAPEAPDEPTLRPCHGPSPDGLTATPVGRWLLDRTVWPLAPRMRPVHRPPTAPILTSQHRGPDIFRPPRARTAPRSGSTRPAHTVS